MINLFSLAENDRSIQYLREVFGSMAGVLTLPGEPAAETSITILGTMFNTFNAIALAVGALIIVYVTIVGVMKTAHEGEMMGKQWNSLWIPLRMVMGVASLVPTASGYSTIQIIMMWVIVQGIAAADGLWGTVLNYISTVGSPTAQITIPSVGLDQTISDLYKGLVCDATFKESLPNPDATGEGKYFCSAGGSPFCGGAGAFTPFNPDENLNSYSMGPNGACGILTYCNQAQACAKEQNSLKCRSCKTQVEALDAMINGTLGPLAVQFEKTDYSYRNFWYNNNPSAGASFNGDWIYAYCSANGISRERCCVPGSGIDCKATVNPFESFFTDNNKNPQNPSEQAVQNLYWTYSIAPLTDNKNFLKTNKAYYLSALNKNVADFITEQGTEGSVVANSNLGKVLQYAQRTGWVMAGTLYYVISQQNNANLRDAVPDIGVAGAVNLLNSPLLTQYRQNYDAAGKLLEAARDQATPGPGEETGGSQRSKMPSSLGPQSAAIGEAMNSVASTFQQTTEAGASGGTHINPLVQLQQAGYAMLLIASVLYITLVLVTFVVGLGGNISIFALGFGAVNPLGPAAILIYFILAPMIFGLLSVLIGVGGMLGVYVPLIPYIIFTLGVIGWFMSTIETMVAGPLVALGILAPGGQHEILGKAEPALMLLFSLFLRPSLMIFGLMAAMLLSVVVVAMINSGFGLVITTIGSLGTTTTFAVDAKGNIYSEGGAAALANPLEVILFLCAYVTLIVTALNKCFSAIHVIPEKVMRWLGAQGEAYGEAEGMREVKGGVEAGEAGGKGAVKGQEQRAEKREIRAAGESKNTGMKVGDVKDARKKKE